MPILDVENSGTVLFIKRSMASGYAGVDNELFFRDNTMMLFSDAKKMVEDIVKSLDEKEILIKVILDKNIGYNLVTLNLKFFSEHFFTSSCRFVQ